MYSLHVYVPQGILKYSMTKTFRRNKEVKLKTEFEEDVNVARVGCSTLTFPPIYWKMHNTYNL